MSADNQVIQLLMDLLDVSVLDTGPSANYATIGYQPSTLDGSSIIANARQ
jgi:hypothetical protein